MQLSYLLQSCFLSAKTLQVFFKSPPVQRRELCTVILASTWMWLQCLEAWGGSEHSCILEIKDLSKAHGEVFDATVQAAGNSDSSTSAAPSPQPWGEAGFSHSCFLTQLCLNLFLYKQHFLSIFHTTVRSKPSSCTVTLSQSKKGPRVFEWPTTMTLERLCPPAAE